LTRLTLGLALSDRLMVTLSKLTISLFYSSVQPRDMQGLLAVKWLKRNFVSLICPWVASLSSSSFFMEVHLVFRSARGVEHQTLRQALPNPFKRRLQFSVIIIETANIGQVLQTSKVMQHWQADWALPSMTRHRRSTNIVLCCICATLHGLQSPFLAISRVNPTIAESCRSPGSQNLSFLGSFGYFGLSSALQSAGRR
jgi:hypothetical protein